MGCHNGPVYETESDRSGGAVAALRLQTQIKRKEIQSMTGVVKVKESKKMPPREKREFYRELFSLAVPVGLQNLLVALIGASDALMLGRLSQDAVAAVSLANQMAFIMNLFAGSLVAAGGTLIAQYWGKGDKETAKNLFCMINKYVFLISFIFFVLAMFVPGTLMRIYTPDEGLIQIGASYLRIVSVSYLFTGLTQCYYLIMKIEGQAFKSMVISIAALVADVVIDFFLIYGIAGAPRLEADGSAYSTVVVEAIALLWCVAESRSKGNIRIDMKGLGWFSREISRDLFKIVWPMLASSLAWGIGLSLHSLIMGHQSADATAAASITSVAQELVTCICKGISTGAGIMVGKLLGQDLFEKAKAYGRKFCHISFCVGGIHMALLGILGPVVAEFFVLSDTARQYLIMMLIFTAFYVFAYSVNTIIVCGIFPAGGDAKYDAISVFFASWCFALPLALLGTFVFHWPVMVVYALMNADEIVKVPWIYPRYGKYLWVKNLTREDGQV